MIYIVDNNVLEKVPKIYNGRTYSRGLSVFTEYGTFPIEFWHWFQKCRVYE